MDVFEFNHLDEAIALLVEAVQQGAGKAADAMADAARQNAPEETGFLQSSIYTSGPDGSTYGQDMESPPGDSYALPEEQPEAGETLVGVAANYGAYVELGTRHMAPEPFLAPAAESVGGNLESYFDGVEDHIAGGLP